MTTKKVIKCDLPVLMAKAEIDSISELQRRTGLPRTTLTRLYNDEATVIGHKTIYLLCKVFDCSIGELLKSVTPEEKAETAAKVKERRVQNRDAYVYFAKDPLTSLVKIGKSLDVEKRLYQLKKEVGSELQLLDVVKSSDAIVLEKEIHEQLHDRRVKGEWFTLSEEEVEKVVKTIKEA